MNRLLRQTSRLALSNGNRKAASMQFMNGFNVSVATSSSQNVSGQLTSRRFNSGTPDKPVDVSDVASSVIDPTGLPEIVSAISEPNWAISSIMNLVENVHIMADVPYWGAIVLTTIGIRVLLFPVALKTVQGSARMAAMRPEMARVQETMKNDPNFADARVKMKYQQEMKAIFAKHDVKPLRAMMWPFVQFPVFIGFFLALREMGDYYPGFVTGGFDPFINLAAADPTYILPIVNAVSFLAIIEMGSDGMNTEQTKPFKMAMRGLAVLMVPLMGDMPVVRTIHS
jgi:YidC/Oxa1 family membrane protein insertase